MKKTDAEIFEEKYNRYGDMLYRIAFLYLSNAQDAEDVLQEVFIKLLYSSPEFKSSEHEKAWLIRVTQNQCKNLLRSPKRKNCSVEDLQLAEESENNDLKLDVVRQVTALPLKIKEAVILYYYCGYSVALTAKILKTGKSAVKMRLKKGRQLLKISLEDYEYE